MEEQKEEIQEEVKEEILEEPKEEVKTEPTPEAPKKSSKAKLLIPIIGVLFLVVVLVAVAIVVKKTSGNGGVIKQDTGKYKSEYRMSGNSVEDFDLVFLQLENNAQNKVYSPLSIKYTLQMLGEGASEDTKAQIDAVVGDYKSRKYNNNDHMSFANAFFIRTSFRDYVKESYVKALSDKYNAEIIYTSLDQAEPINSWVKNKTFDLIDGLVSDDEMKQADYQFILINALAIDMNWNYCIQPATGAKIPYMNYAASYVHENFSDYVSRIENDRYKPMAFNGQEGYRSVEFAATLNNYDIVKTLGEENIRKTVGEEYDAFLAEGGCGDDLDRETYLDQYIKELNTNYKKVDISTDFYMYDDDSIKVFAKDLKEYDGMTLQYVGIMPKNESLGDYIKNINAKKVTEAINNLKEIKSENFEEGTIINIKGQIPLFNYSDDLELMKDLQLLGIKDVFTSKANLSNMITAEDVFITEVKHKATIEFSNEGIKAAATTMAGGAGASGCYFDHIYEVPVKKIDLTFDKPYIYLIRDKETGEVWFVGAVYEPTKN